MKLQQKIVCDMVAMGQSSVSTERGGEAWGGREGCGNEQKAAENTEASFSKAWATTLSNVPRRRRPFETTGHW